MTTSLDKMIADFKSLSNEQKREKMIQIYALLQDKIDISKWIIDFINKTKDISDEFFENNYAAIMKVALKQCEEQDNKELETKIKKLTAIQDEEQKQKMNEEQDIDTMIDGI